MRLRGALASFQISILLPNSWSRNIVQRRHGAPGGPRRLARSARIAPGRRHVSVARDRRPTARAIAAHERKVCRYRLELATRTLPTSKQPTVNSQPIGVRTSEGKRTTPKKKVSVPWEQFDYRAVRHDGYHEDRECERPARVPEPAWAVRRKMRDPQASYTSAGRPEDSTANKRGKERTRQSGPDIPSKRSAASFAPIKPLIGRRQTVSSAFALARPSDPKGGEKWIRPE